MSTGERPGLNQKNLCHVVYILHNAKALGEIRLSPREDPTTLSVDKFMTDDFSLNVK